MTSPRTTAFDLTQRNNVSNQTPVTSEKGKNSVVGRPPCTQVRGTSPCTSGGRPPFLMTA